MGQRRPDGGPRPECWQGFAANAWTRWFRQRFVRPTPAQTEAWPHLAHGRHTLIVSPTGTGKTLAAFFAVLHRLAEDHDAGRLGPGFQAIYVSPLRALGYDLEKNLRGPLHEIYGEPAPIRVGLRTGDTSAGDRQRLLTHPPHLLLTTPESLSLLLSQAKWIPLLARVRWVIIDEIHALAENKRGSHLSLSLERLTSVAQAAREGEANAHAGDGLAGAAEGPVRIGLSATVAPLGDMAQFLVGNARRCAIVDVSSAKRLDLSVYTPLAKDPYPAAGFSGIRLIGELARLIRKHRTTLVFTNTRSGAESAAYRLREKLPELASSIECHHASLDRDVRREVEDRLKRGELRAVVCSTSLELGVDIGSVDLVVMLAAPKGVTRALQRTGRSGHDIRRVSRGLLMATNVHDLVECCATARLARAGHLDDVRLPRAPLDVLAQHLVGMGCLGRCTRQAAWDLVRRAWPYRELTPGELDDTLDYLAGGGRVLRQQYTELFGKIVLDETGFETRPGAVRRDFWQNVGTIPNEGVVHVREAGRPLATVEESFARQLQPGDVFILSGRAVRMEKHGMMEMRVAPAVGALPTVPRWNANKMPLSNRVACEIQAFRSEVRSRLEQGGAGPQLEAWIATRLGCSARNAAVVARIHATQHRWSEIPTADFLLIEAYQASAAADLPADLPPPPPTASRSRRTSRRGARTGDRARPAAVRCYFFHSLIGRGANDALARVVALRLSRLGGGNAIATPDDYGFLLTVGVSTPLRSETVRELLSPVALVGDLEASLRQSELLKYHFRNAAQTGLMVYRNYFGRQKPLRKVQFSSEVILNVLLEHEPDHVLLREARQETLHGFLDVAGALRFADALRDRPVRLRAIDRLPPLSFPMYAATIREALWLEDPNLAMERLYHHWWQRTQDEGGPA
ncbi:MAG: DEAD/DEAH box helicase [Verrucomicrobiales bacterium]|nr:DEAD/DEAH box helicase [Verrucomicrobiales bacterium]